MNTKNIRFIGRHINKEGSEYFSFSGCGFEFIIKTQFQKVSFVLSLISHLREDKEQYVGIYVNDTFHSKAKLIEGLNEFRIDLDTNEKELIIKVIKLNEVYISSMQLLDIKLSGAEFCEIKPSKKKLIGFFGDSLTCGYGLDDYHGLEFKTAGEDFTKTYACLACLALNMDYTVVARSGISVANPIYVDRLFMEIYDTVDMMEKCVDERKLDYAVINLGTNDANAFSLLNDEKEKKVALKTFEIKYKELVETIIKDNPGVKLVLSYRMVNINELFVDVIKEIKNFINNHYDNRCELLEFSPNSDGACSHPYKTAHEENAKLLVNLIKKMEA